MRLFTVIDKETGTEPDLELIALNEPWAKDLIYCDMEGFTIGPDGELYLLDECGSYKACPLGRFEVVWLEKNQPSGPVPDMPVDERDQT